MKPNDALAQFYLPFPSEIGPFVEETDSAILAWLEQLRVVKSAPGRQRFLSANIGQLASRMGPHLPREGVKLLAHWLTCVFFADDLMEATLMGRPENLKAFVQENLDILRGNTDVNPGNVLGRAIAELRDLTFQGVGLGWRDRMLCDYEEYTRGCIQESELRKRGETLSFAQYGDIRVANAAVYPLFESMAVGAGLVIPESVWNGELKAVIRHTANLVVWTHDVVSVNKDITDRNPVNVVLALARDHGLTLPNDLPAALERAISLVREEVARFEAAVAAASNLGPVQPAVDTMVQMMRSSMRGSLDWHLARNRRGYGGI
jgi:hypothetical protein